MLSANYEVTISFLNVNGGDAIWIRFLGDDNKWHNVLVDGGYGWSYKNAFGPLLTEILSKDEYVDLWIVTHIDLDHIGAVMGFLQDKKIQNKKAAIKEFWFNHPAFPLQDFSNKIAVGQGIKLRDYLIESSQVASAMITIDTVPKNYYGLTLKVVSPTPEKQELANKKWETREKKVAIGRSFHNSGHRETIDALRDKPFTEDSDVTNGSSISVLLQYKHVTGLLLADSHPSDVCSILKKWGYSLANPLQVDFLQLAHHGSKANTSKELLEMIATSQYIITGNGITNRHPDKETLARVLTNASRGSTHLNFSFTSNTKEIRNLFEADEEPYNRFNFSCNYPDTGANYFILNFIPVHKNGS